MQGEQCPALSKAPSSLQKQTQRFYNWYSAGVSLITVIRGLPSFLFASHLFNSISFSATPIVSRRLSNSGLCWWGVLGAAAPAACASCSFPNLKRACMCVKEWMGGLNSEENANILLCHFTMDALLRSPKVQSCYGCVNSFQSRFIYCRLLLRVEQDANSFARWRGWTGCVKMSNRAGSELHPAVTC